MADAISAARQFADQIRYSSDPPCYNTISDAGLQKRVFQTTSMNDLLVSSLVTPKLEEEMERVCSNLAIPRNAIDAFIFASPEIQAECHAPSADRCLLRFSSALVELLDEEEFGFVVGHEIGHFLLKHGLHGGESMGGSLEYFMKNRAQEISADRIGLVGCRSLDAVVRALMKTVSGLSSRHLRFHVGQFLQQLDGAKGDEFSKWATHPSMFVRCRAIFWFSMSEDFRTNSRVYNSDDLRKLDGYVERDVDKFVDGSAKSAISAAELDLLLWLVADRAVSDGLLDRRDQDCIGEMFGQETLSGLKGFLSDQPSSSVQSEVFGKIEAARQLLERLAPGSFTKKYQNLLERAKQAIPD